MTAYPDERTPPSSGRDDSGGDVQDDSLGEGRPASVQRAVRGSTRPSAAGDAKGATQDRSRTTLDTERYSDFRVSGRGGSGSVVRAIGNDIVREVAIKIFDPDLADDGSEIDRFAEEARITGQLEHPNIVPVYELGTDQLGRRFLSMKLVQGATLEQTLQRLGDSRLDPVHLAEFLQVFVKVCDAASFAHSRRGLHRDIKPTNIMISDFGQVYVLDWGIARLRARDTGDAGPRVRVSVDLAAQSAPDPPGSLIGTTCYMAPEQLRGQHDALDERTDVFALGATLYQILTGQPPLTPEIERAIWMHKNPAPISRPGAVAPGPPAPLDLYRLAPR